MSQPNKGIRTGHTLTENLNALEAVADHRTWMRSKGRMCWKCQKTKPLAGGRLTKTNGKQGKFSSTDKFVCADCLPPTP